MPKTKVDELREALEKRKAREDSETSDETTVEESEISSELAAAQEEAKTHYDKLLRTMADFDNYRRRMDKDKQEFAKYANESLVRELITVLDHLDQALTHITQSSSAEAKNLAMGVELVQKQLLGTLEKNGLQAIDALGKPFDPSLHEAVQMVDAEDASPGTVVAQHARGYKLYDRLLRAAMVDVAREK